MDSASSLAYPGSRHLAGWLRQLQPRRPAGLWVGYLFVHRVEALVESRQPRPIDALTLHVLQAIAVDQPAGGPHVHTADPLPARLHLPAPALHQLLAGLERQTLVRRCEPGCWCLSEHGQDVLQARADHSPQQTRLAFPFVERLGPTGRRLAPPHFLPIAECPAVAWEVSDAHRFDLSCLRDSLAQPATWQDRYGFPKGIHRILGVSDGVAEDAWQRIIVDRPERIALVLIALPDRSVVGFAVGTDGWHLHDETPVLHLGEAARDALGNLTVAPTAWEEAWRLWCRQRHLPLSEAEACRLHFDGIHLDVLAPPAFVQRLRAAKSDILRDESGLMAGDGYLRAAALLRLQAQP